MRNWKQWACEGDYAVHAPVSFNEELKDVGNKFTHHGRHLWVSFNEELKAAQGLKQALTWGVSFNEELKGTISSKTDNGTQVSFNEELKEVLYPLFNRANTSIL